MSPAYRPLERRRSRGINIIRSRVREAGGSRGGGWRADWKHTEEYSSLLPWDPINAGNTHSTEQREWEVF